MRGYVTGMSNPGEQHPSESGYQQWPWHIPDPGDDADPGPGRGSGPGSGSGPGAGQSGQGSGDRALSGPPSNAGWPRPATGPGGQTDQTGGQLGQVGPTGQVGQVPPGAGQASPGNPYTQPLGRSTPPSPGAPPGPYGPFTGTQALGGLSTTGGQGQVPAQQGGPFSGTPGTVPLSAVRDRRKVPGWIWALGGALLASAVWAGSLLATGGFTADDNGGGKADLAGYSYPSDMCEPFDRSALAARYSQESGDPTSYGSKHRALSSAYCRVTLKTSGSEYARTYVSFTGDWHKESDPGPEFAPRQKAYKNRSDSTSTYKVREVGGIGDEAYLVVDASGGDTVRWASLAVRDGWFEGTLEWSNYGTGPNDDGASLSEKDLRGMMTTDMKATLEALKK